MYRLVQFFKKYSSVLLFIILEAGAIGYYASSTSYTRATLLASSNKVTAGIHGIFSSIGDYFTLGRENRMLMERLAETETLLSALSTARDTATIPVAEPAYYYSTATVISNSIARQDNFFVINKGTRDGVEENMAILSADGSVAGYVRKCSDKFAVCMSALNRDFRIGGQLKGSEYFGSVYWDGTDAREMTMEDSPTYADVSVGDTLLSAYSSRVPPDTFIGTVSSVKESEDGTYYILRIRLGARMNALGNVLLVKYTDYEELETLAGEYFADYDTRNPQK